MTNARLLPLAVCGMTLLSSSSALAVEPAELKHGFSVAGLTGFGENAYGFDFGVRAGYTLPSNVYLGGTFLYNAGFSGWGSGFTTGLEVGYQFAAGPIVVRPYGGIGFSLERYTYQVYDYYYGYYANPDLCALGYIDYCAISNPYHTTTTSAAFWGGGTAIYNFKGGPWFVTADVRLGVAPALYAGNFLFACMAGGGYEF